MTDMNTILQSFLNSPVLIVGSFAMMMVVICGVVSMLVSYVDSPKIMNGQSPMPSALLLSEGMHHTMYPPFC